MCYVCFLEGQAFGVHRKYLVKKYIESHGIASHFFESLQKFGHVSRMVANSRKSTHLQMKNRKACESAKSDKNFLLVE